MSATTVFSDNGVSSGSPGGGILGGNDGTLKLQVTDGSGAAQDSVFINNNRRVGVNTLTPQTVVDIVGPAGVTNFFGTTHLGTIFRAGSTNTELVGVDFTSAPSSNPLARIGVVFTTSGSRMTFGLSTNYASGITSTPLILENDGNTNVTASLNVAGGATINGTLTAVGQLLMDNGFGFSAITYGVRVWANFQGTNAPNIRGSGGVSSIVFLNTGDYRINFSYSIPNNNYAVFGIAKNVDNNAATLAAVMPYSFSGSGVSIRVTDSSNNPINATNISFCIVR